MCTQLLFAAFFTVLLPTCTSVCDLQCICLFASHRELLTQHKIESDEVLYSESLLKLVGVFKEHENLTDYLIERSYDEK
jgi:hypothetical protein